MIERNQIIQQDLFNIISTSHNSFFTDKTILVTGASGLLGTYLASYFNYLNSNNICNVNLLLSSRSGHFEIEGLERNSLVIAGNLTHEETLNQIPMCDIIIHAAGYGQPDKFLEDYQNSMKLNSTVTLELTKKLKRNGTMLFISSSEVYSGLGNPPFKEFQIGTTNTIHHRSSYIEGKRFGEAVMANESERNPAGRYHSARLALAYGPGVRKNDERVINTFVRDAISKGIIKLKDSGSAWRTYCYVTDAVDMCLAILTSGTEKIYNIGGCSRVQIIDLANEIARQTESKVQVPNYESGQFKKGAPEEVWLDLSLINQIRTQNRFVNLRDGVSNLIAWSHNQFSS